MSSVLHTCNLEPLEPVSVQILKSLDVYGALEQIREYSTFHTLLGKPHGRSGDVREGQRRPGEARGAQEEARTIFLIQFQCSEEVPQIRSSRAHCMRGTIEASPLLAKQFSKHYKERTTNDHQMSWFD